ASSSFKMWNGFHGDSSCGDHVTEYVRNYASLSMDVGAGDNWLDIAYDGAFWPWETDDCPVSIVFGSPYALRSNMNQNGGFLSRPDTGAKTGSTYFYVS